MDPHCDHGPWWHPGIIVPHMVRGNGLALQKYIDDGKLPLLQQMYKAV